MACKTQQDFSKFLVKLFSLANNPYMGYCRNDSIKLSHSDTLDLYFGN